MAVDTKTLKERKPVMKHYTERHGMRPTIAKTYDISVDSYALLLGCCEKYYDNIAWKYPKTCPDGYECCGLSQQKLLIDLKYEIPTLHKDEYGRIANPRQVMCAFSDEVEVDSYDQYALLDYIEFIGESVRDISKKEWHSYFGHYDLTFNSTNTVLTAFRNEINDAFRKTGLLYKLTESGEIERIEECGVLNEIIESSVAQITENGLRGLLRSAITLHKSPRPADQEIAVEKIWDALERMKTYYTGFDKKASVSKIVYDISNGESEFVELFNNEFMALTQIGNSFRIRHHETNKTDICDVHHYDYLFNRCLSLIALSLQYLRQ